jgi:hypothetical protein
MTMVVSNSRFLRDDDEKPSSWDEQLATKYYTSLYREFAVCDLKHYKSGNVRFLLFLRKFSSDDFNHTNDSLHYVGEPKKRSLQAQERRHAEIHDANATLHPVSRAKILNSR